MISAFIGIGSEICARIMEHETFFHLDAPVIRVTGMFLFYSNHRLHDNVKKCYLTVSNQFNIHLF